MKKNWKCIIGAILLAPVCLGIAVAMVVGLVWTVEKIPYNQVVEWIAVGVAILFGLGGIWIALFTHCKEHWSKKGEES